MVQGIFQYNEICVALDLETTGLDPNVDEIIEIGAIKFKGDTVIDTFHSLVNPYKELSPFIMELTGIGQEQVDEAPPFASISLDLITFLGDHPIVGQNVFFDINFLAKNGIYKEVSYDTREMAAILMPQLREYSLAFLSSSLGLVNNEPHRALSDTKVTLETFNKLVQIASSMNEEILVELSILQAKAGNGLAGLFSRIRNSRPEITSQIDIDVSKENSPENFPAVGLHNDVVSDEIEFSVSDISELFIENGGLASTLQNYKYRSQQVAMAKSVTSALQSKQILIVEAGTGVGKSMAYLIPSIVLAMREGKRVIVSTNTINLQEQLINKDIPNILEALSRVDDSFLQFRFALLKGRDNYVCRRLFNNMRSSLTLSREDAKMACKILVWMQQTRSGDRSEVTIENHDLASWSRISSATSINCPYRDGAPCFLRDARETAEGSHLVVVNHALLLRDIIDGNGVIPEYDYLIIDEAHNLEGEATRQFGSSISRLSLDEYLSSINGQNGIIESIRSYLVESKSATSTMNIADEIVLEMESSYSRLRDNTEFFWDAVSNFLAKNDTGADSRQLTVRLNRENMSNREWHAVEVTHGNVDLALSVIENNLDRIYSRLELQIIEDETAAGVLEMKISNVWKSTRDVKEQLRSFMVKEQIDKVLWVSQGGNQANVVMNSAPIEVGGLLNTAMYSKKDSVVLTSATLAIQGNLEYIHNKLGLDSAEELILGSSFDYPNAVLLTIPTDMPQINAWDHQESLVKAIIDICQAVDGNTMVLFTSHASLRLARNGVKDKLKALGYQVLAQGVDGTPRQLMATFEANQRSLLLGTSSFWEGVDFQQGSLKALIIPRLPFNVPTDPIFAARSELVDNSFNDYALPLAAIRFRQGFGRLIRSEEDRGIVAILDRRILSRSYGKVFLESIPETAVAKVSLRQMPVEINRWLNTR